MKITRKQLRKLLNESVKLSFKPRATPGEKDQMKDVLSDLNQGQYYTKFRNELDNEIELSIEPHHGQVEGQLTITLRGPDSEATNTITREEAVQLNEMLTQYLIEETSRDDFDASLE